MNLKFDTRVQELKYKVLKEIAKAYFNDTLSKEYLDIPQRIVPGPKPTMRCCIYKERAILLERMKLALGGNKEINNVVEVIKVACDECPLGGYEVTNRCRGCIAHRCAAACHRNAITFDSETYSAKINKDLCVNCGMCAKACQYNAIQNYQRPCEVSCKVKAISMDVDHAAHIDDEKCIQCGACVYQCPFGAIMDKSYITNVIDILKDSEFSKKYPVYAIVAPAISAQFKYATLGQLVNAIEQLGFSHVVEAALGADMVAYKEAQELAEKGFLTSSCCPAFVSLIRKYYAKLADNISSNLSPMATIAKWIKENNPNAKTVFIGPCVAKKREIQDEKVKPYVDVVITFEELQAMIDARDIDVTTVPESELFNASAFGRTFARCGGLADAVKEALKEQNSDFELKATSADGVDNCKLMLTKANANKENNFLEGMACSGGCIGGPCCLTHEFRDKLEVDKYSKSAKEKTIEESIANLSKKV